MKMSSELDETKKQLSFPISKRKPKKIATMTRDDAERHSPEAAALQQKAAASVSLPKITKEEKDHEHSMARSELHAIDKAIKILRKKLKGEGNIEAWVQSKITRAADYLDSASNYVDSGEHNNIEEETMTPEQKAKEKKLKAKYDKSDMKQNMIDQYGEEKGTQVYFAKIRKMATEQTQLDEVLGTGRVVAGRTIPGREGGPGVTQAGTVQKVMGVKVPGSFTPGASKSDVKRHDTANPKQAIMPRHKPPTDSQIMSGKGGHYVTGVTADKPKPMPSTAKVAPKPTMAQKGAEIRSNIEKRNQAISAAMKELRQSFEYDGTELEEAKLSRTARRAARAGKPGYDADGKPKPKGKVRAWDMDETLMRNDPKKIRVHVKDKEGKRIQSLTNQEFNVHKLDKEKGHSYDFGEFRSSEKFSKASTPNKSMIKKLKKQVRKGKPVHIVTARGSFDDQPKFAKHLRKHGIEIDPGKAKGGRHVHVHRAGDMPGSDIGEKKVKIVKGLMKKHGTKGAEMYDDAAKVHRAFKKSGLKVKTKMVQPNKKDVTQARSFKEDFDYNLLYDFLLEQLILEEIAENYEDASMIIESLDDELLEDFIYQGYEFISTVLEEETIMQEEMSPKINYVSPYKKIQEKREIKKDYLSEEQELTPYEYWKSFIGDNEETEIVTEAVEMETEIQEEVEMTSYEKWKKILEEV